MLSPLRTLLLLSVLYARSSSLCSLRLLSPRGSDVLCALEPPGPPPGAADPWGALFRSSSEFLSSSDSSRAKRTSAGLQPNYRILSHTKLRSKLLQNRSDRRSSRVTLSLDVPTNIMNILFDIAKAKNLRAKAANNARLLAQIGRK